MPPCGDASPHVRVLAEEAGQTAAEYLGLLVVIAMVVAGLASSGIGQAVQSGAQRQLCRMLADVGCVAVPQSPPPVAEPPPVAPAAPTPAPRLESARRSAEAPAAERGALDHAVGFVGGLAGGAADAVVGIVDAARLVDEAQREVTGFAWRSITDPQQRAQNSAAWEFARANPARALELSGARELPGALWRGVTDPIVTEWRNGRPGAAVGRGVAAVAEVFLGGKGVAKLKGVRRLDDLSKAATIRRRPDVPRSWPEWKKWLSDETGSIGPGNPDPPGPAPRALAAAPGTSQWVKNLVAPGGTLIGKAGSKGVRELPGGDMAARKLFAQLTQGATPHHGGRLGGQLYRLTDQGYVGYGPSSRSGPPTVDINIPQLRVKIKFL